MRGEKNFVCKINYYKTVNSKAGFLGLGLEQVEIERTITVGQEGPKVEEKVVGEPRILMGDALTLRATLIRKLIGPWVSS